MCGGDEKPGVDDWKTPEHLKPKSPAEAGHLDLVVEEFPLTFEGYTYPHSRIAYVKGRGPCPVVIVHHNYAGLKQFDIDQACFLARAGYVGLALDSYKETPDYSIADRNPLRSAGDAAVKQHFQKAFQKMNDLLWGVRSWRNLMGAYLEAAFAHPAVERGLAGAIGYCLGGQACLEQLRAGHQLQAIVTFHGLLHSRPMPKDQPGNPMVRLTLEEYKKQVDVPPTTCSPGCRVVIENGALDEHVPLEAVGEWMVEMDEHKVDWRFNNHARTPHGFALSPGVTATSYVEAVDRRSTMSMLATFAEAWPEHRQFYVEANACGTSLPNAIVVKAVAGGKGKGKSKEDGEKGAQASKKGGRAEGKGKGKGSPSQAKGKGKGKWQVKQSAL